MRWHPVKMVAQLHENFARVQVMGAPEGEAIVEEQAAIGDVEPGNRKGEVLAKVFAECQVKGSVAGQVTRRGIAI